MIDILLTAVCAALTIVLLLWLLNRMTEWLDSKTTIEPYKPPKLPEHLDVGDNVEVDGKQFQIMKAEDISGPFPLDFSDAQDVRNPYFQVARVDEDGEERFVPASVHDRQGNLITRTPDGKMYRYNKKDLEDLMPTNYYRYYSLRKGDEEIGYGRR